MTDFRALCAELADELTQFNAWYIEDNGYGLPALEALLRRSDAALAQSDEPAVPEGREPASVISEPSDEEIIELWHGSDWYNEGATLREFLSIARAVLARWGNPAPQPVLVSEQLPGPDDCDAEGRCWWGEPQIGDSHDATWNLCTQDEAEEYCTWGTKYGWLPAHALPLPTVND